MGKITFSHGYFHSKPLPHVLDPDLLLNKQHLEIYLGEAGDKVFHLRHYVGHDISASYYLLRPSIDAYCQTSKNTHSITNIPLNDLWRGTVQLCLDPHSVNYVLGLKDGEKCNELLPHNGFYPASIVIEGHKIIYDCPQDTKHYSTFDLAALGLIIADCSLGWLQNLDCTRIVMFE